MVENQPWRKIHFILVVAIAMCFIGHGAFGIITKPIWCNYFGVFGIGKELSFKLMPVVGAVDIFLGIWILIYPSRFVPLWLVFWGAFTALLRPLSGEYFAEFLERAGNYGAPFAFLVMTGMPAGWRSLFTKSAPPSGLNKDSARLLNISLRIAGFLLMAGHGWLNLLMKKSLLLQYESLGFADPVMAAKIVGIAELTAALIILIKPWRELLVFIFLWKMLSETFYPAYPLFEWIERGGSYGVLLSLCVLLTRDRLIRSHTLPELKTNPATAG